MVRSLTSCGRTLEALLQPASSVLYKPIKCRAVACHLAIAMLFCQTGLGSCFLT